ncbi:hypothetical protein AX15_000285 [Amanita polypyramis BW_CC]|nr:hypothetical protein AX15_000285 [Amanita polypyramis BW_CC]
MSNTTQVLFNSPALHSLKRHQLIKLCKIHAIKATGKNAELIEKLKQHALTLPRDAPLSIAARSEIAPLVPRVDGALESGDRTRPSEQWEVVMDRIEEIEETSSAQGSLNSLGTVGKDKPAGEFGTGGYKSSVSSSLKAFATSLRLKRSGALNTTASKSSSKSASTIAPEVETTDGPAQFVMPYSRPPPGSSIPRSDPFTHDGEPMPVTDIEAPVPGQALRPGVPAPLNARLSLGLGLTERHTPSREPQPTTTIRLISNQCSGDELQSPISPTPRLAPFKTNFDLIMSPRMASGINFGNSVYPALPSESNTPSAQAELPHSADMDGDIAMPGTFSSPCPQTLPAVDLTSDVTMASPSQDPSGDGLKLSEPFIFGSPLPRHRVSDAQFREAAASVLNEMNRRLQVEGINPVDFDIIKRLHPSGSAGGPETTESLSTSSAGGRQASDITEMFERKHQAEFDKMEGIDVLLKRRAAPANKNEESHGKVSVGKKRKSSVVIDEPRRAPTQIVGRASGTRVISNGRRSRMMPGTFDSEYLNEGAGADEERGKKRAKMDSNGADVHNANLEEQKRKEKEREAIRRRLEINKARRRSSAAAARQSGQVSIERVQPKQKPSRFGFLAQAKSIVQSVFGRSKPAMTGSSTVMAPTASSRAKAGKTQEPDQSHKKTLGNLTSVSATETGLVVGTTRSSGSTGVRAVVSHEREKLMHTAQSRSPIPAFNDQDLMGTRPKKSSAPAITTISRDSCVPSDINTVGRKPLKAVRKVSSMGARGSLANKSAVGSLGVKKEVERGQVSSSSSRLHAPTASSLAKINSRVSTPTPGAKELPSDIKQVSGTSSDRMQNALSSITNNSGYDTAATLRVRSPPTVGKPFGKLLKVASPSSSSIATMENEPKVDIHTALNATKPVLERQRTLSGKKPRISRSKVISRLASQRANTVKNDGKPSAGVRRASASGKTRSSLDMRSKPVGRFSHTGLRVNGSGNELLMSAKKRARQSEYYARRRSRIEVKPGRT